jgi:hypothetical protein
MSIDQQPASDTEKSGDQTALSPAPYLLAPEPETLQPSPAFQPWDTTSDSAEQAGQSDSFWERRGLWLGLAALFVAAVGEYLLFAESSRGWGVGLLLAAALAGVVAWSGARSMPVAFASRGQGTLWRRIAWRRGLALRLAGITAAMALSIGSIVAYMHDPYAIFGLQGVLWLAGMALLLLSCAFWYPRRDAVLETDEGRPTTDDRRSTKDEGRTVLSVRMKDDEGRKLNPQSAIRNPQSEAPAWIRLEILVFAGLVALSLITHLALLDQLPWRLHFDEGFAYIEVMRYYRGPAIPLFTTTWAGTSLPSMWFGLEGLLMHITGPSLAGVRLGVALAGALTVVPVYGLGRLLAGRMGATLAAFAVAVSAAYVHYSRVSIINVTTPLAWAVCFYFLVKGLRSRRPGDFVWAGLAAGLSMYTYYGTRLLPYLLLVFLAYLLIFHFKASRERLGHFALVGFGFAAGFGPLIGYFMLNPQMWTGRGISQLNIPPGMPTSWDAIVADWNILAPLLWKDFLGLGVIPGRDTVYYAPFLLPIEAAILVIGASVLVWRWRQPASFLVLLWGLGVILTGGILLDADSIPNFAHWTPAFPAFYLALALPLALCWNSLVRLPGRRLRVAGSILIVMLMAMDLGANAYAYLVQYPPLVPADHSLEGAQGRYVESVPPATHVRSVGYTWVWNELDGPINEMMASPGSSLSRFFNPSRELPVVEEPGRNLAFLFYNDMYDYLPLMQSYYPGGTAGELRSPDGNLIADTYFVPSSVAASRYGVLANLAPINVGSGPGWGGQVATVGALPGGVQLSYPQAATWTGAFYLSELVPVELHVQGADNARLWVQGRPVLPDTPLDLQPGWVHFSVSARLDKPGSVKLLLQQGNTPATEIDNTHLWPMPLDQGLAVTMGGPSSSHVHRIDPFLGSGLLQPVRGSNPDLDPEALPLFAAGPGSTQIRWEGELNTADGPYAMKIRSDAAFQLTIDGTSVIKMCATPQGNQVGYGQIQLKAGWHQVRIDYQVGGHTDGMEWFWTRPDGVSEVVPHSALRIGSPISNMTTVSWPLLPAPVPCQ